MLLLIWANLDAFVIVDFFTKHKRCNKLQCTVNNFGKERARRPPSHRSASCRKEPLTEKSLKSVGRRISEKLPELSEKLQELINEINWAEVSNASI